MLLYICAPVSGGVEFCMGREPPVQGGRVVEALYLRWPWGFLASFRVVDCGSLVCVLAASLLGNSIWLCRYAVGRWEGMTSTFLLRRAATGSRGRGHLGSGLIRNMRVTMGNGVLPADSCMAAVVAVLPHKGVRSCCYLPCFSAVGGSV